MSETRSTHSDEFPPISILSPVIEIAISLRNRPGFAKAKALLEVLFVELLEYDSAIFRLDVRLAFPPSSPVNAIWSIAESSGIRVLIIDHGDYRIRGSNFSTVFERFPECLLFVVSAITGRVRIVMREPAGRRRLLVTGITPTWAFGARSDNNASWALRLALLFATPRTPSYLRYPALVDALTSSWISLLARFDPFAWDTQRHWSRALGEPSWHARCTTAYRRFLQPDPEDRIPIGLHEALLRGFPIFLPDTTYWLDYEDYEIRAGEPTIARVFLRLFQRRSHGIETLCRLEFDFEVPSIDSEGFLIFAGDRWAFRGCVGSITDRWSSGVSTGLTGKLASASGWLSSVAGHEPGGATQIDGVPPAASTQAGALSVLEDGGIDGALADEREDDSAERPPFLRLEDALCSGMNGRMRDLRRRIKRLPMDKGTPEALVRGALATWQGRFPPLMSNLSPFMPFFLEDVCRPLPTARFTPAGRSAFLCQVTWQCPDGRPVWVGRPAQGLSRGGWNVHPEALAHPLLPELLVPSSPQQSAAAPSTENSDHRIQAEDRIAWLCRLFERSVTLDKVAVIPGQTLALVMARPRLEEQGRPIRRTLDWWPPETVPATHPPTEQSVILHRNRIPFQRDRLEYQVRPRRPYSPDTGARRIGEWVSPGEPIIARLLPEAQRRRTRIDRLLLKLFGGGLEQPLRRDDESLYCPPEMEGILEAVSEKRGGPGSAPGFQVTVVGRESLQAGDIITTSFGFYGIISALANVEDMPYDTSGSPVDAMLIVPEDRWIEMQERGQGADLFDGKTGALLERVRLLEDQWASVIESFGARLFSAAAVDERQPSVLEGLQAQPRGVDWLSVSALLAGLGLTQTLEWINRGLRPRQGGFEPGQRATRLLRAMGLVLEASDEGTLHCGPAVAPESPLIQMARLANTVGYLSGQPLQGGLMDPGAFSLQDSEALGRRGRRRDGAPDTPQRFAWLPLPFPVLNPLAIGALAEALGLAQSTVRGILRHELFVQSTDGHVRVVRRVMDGVEGAQTVFTGGEALERLVEDRARELLPGLRQQNWHWLPILPPKERPMLSVADARLRSSRTRVGILGELLHEAEIRGHSWISSDLNQAYLKVGHRTHAFRQMGEGPLSKGPHAFLSRSLLLDAIGNLYGSSGQTQAQLRGTRVSRHHAQWKSPATIWSVWVRQLRSLLGALPQQGTSDILRTCWTLATWDEHCIGVPAKQLMRLWKPSLLRVWLDSGAEASVISRLRTQTEGMVWEFLEYLGGLPRGGLLLSEDGAIRPVPYRATYAHTVQVPPGLVSAWSLDATRPLRLLLPFEKDVSEELLASAGSQRQLGMLEVDPRLVRTVLERHGERSLHTVDCGTRTAVLLGARPISEGEVGFDRGGWRSPLACMAPEGVCCRCLGQNVDDGCHAPLGMNVATLLLRRLARWPMRLQQRLGRALETGETLSAVLISRLSQVEGLDTSPVAILVRLDRTPPRGKPLPLWRLMSRKVVGRLLLKSQPIGTNDFLSRLLLGNLDDLPGQEEQSPLQSGGVRPEMWVRPEQLDADHDAAIGTHGPTETLKMDTLGAGLNEVSPGQRVGKIDGAERGAVLESPYGRLEAAATKSRFGVQSWPRDAAFAEEKGAASNLPGVSEVSLVSTTSRSEEDGASSNVSGLGGPQPMVPPTEAWRGSWLAGGHIHVGHWPGFMEALVDAFTSPGVGHGVETPIAPNQGKESKSTVPAQSGNRLNSHDVERVSSGAECIGKR